MFIMFHIVISGVIDDEVFHHVAMVANYMSKYLPQFHVQKISKSRKHWDEWSEKIGKDKGWCHRTSPMIWKEVSLPGIKAILLGGANEFWEYIYEYYDALSVLEPRDKALFLLDGLKQSALYKRALNQEQKAVQISIVGAAHPMAGLLVMDLLRVPELATNGVVKIVLYDHSACRNTLERLVWDSCAVDTAAGFGSARLVSHLDDAFRGSNIVIILHHKDCYRHEGQSLTDWLCYNRNVMLKMTAAINASAAEDCRVVLAGTGNLPLCFNANIIAEFTTKLHVRNIVAVTADLGQEAIWTSAQSMSVSSASIGQPFVWGCIGLNKLVDIKSTSHVLEAPCLTSRLSLKKTDVHLRNVSYLLKNENEVYLSIAAEKKENEKFLGHPPYLAKVKATVDLLRHWYAVESKRSVILSLGVISNGTFGVPFGMFFSQPVSFVDGFWRPYKAYLLPKATKRQLRCLLHFPCQIMKQFDLGGRFGANWLIMPKDREQKAKIPQDKKRIPQEKAELREEIKIKQKYANSPEKIKNIDQNAFLRKIHSKIYELNKEENESSEQKTSNEEEMHKETQKLKEYVEKKHGSYNNAIESISDNASA